MKFAYCLLARKFVDEKRDEKNGGQRLLHNSRLLLLGKAYEHRIKEHKVTVIKKDPASMFEAGSNLNIGHDILSPKIIN